MKAEALPGAVADGSVFAVKTIPVKETRNQTADRFPRLHRFIFTPSAVFCADRMQIA
jgi:hypothetical protein